MTRALNEILRVLKEANEAEKLTDTIWRSPSETLFDYIENEIEATRCTGCAVADGTHKPAQGLLQIAEPQKFTGDSEMRRAFEIEHGQSWSDPNWRRETGIWASAWRKATNAVQAKHGGTA